jgi:hypothetical protein
MGSRYGWLAAGIRYIISNSKEGDKQGASCAPALHAMVWDRSERERRPGRTLMHVTRAPLPVCPIHCLLVCLGQHAAATTLASLHPSHPRRRTTRT